MKTLVIGLGNPILSDDGVGWRVVEELQSKIVNPKSEIELDCVSLGGLSLMERMLGYQRVILIDAMETGRSPAGSVQVFPLASLSYPMAGHSASTHDATLMTALAAAQALNLPIPKSVDVVAIEAKNVYDFTEELSPPVAAAVPVACQTVLELLKN
jgi:hydrogenase maturation protease